jgi:hypothetical protein
VSSHGGVDAIGQERQPPKKPVRPYSYSEGENESPRLINDEPVEIERDVPETDNKPIEREERQDKPVSISMDNKGPAYKTSCQSRERALSKEKPYDRIESFGRLLFSHGRHTQGPCCTEALRGVS